MCMKKQEVIVYLVKCKAGFYLLMSHSEEEEGSSASQQSGTQWAEIIGQLFDRLTGKGASVTYTFDNLVIDMPKAKGPGGKDMGSAKWTINGKLLITAEAHQTSEEAQRRASVSTTAA